MTKILDQKCHHYYCDVCHKGNVRAGQSVLYTDKKGNYKTGGKMNYRVIEKVWPLGATAKPLLNFKPLKDESDPPTSVPHRSTVPDATGYYWEG